MIKGSQALAFVRQRHGLPNGDLDRIKRQQYFLSAAFHKVVSGGVLLNPFKLRDLLKAISSSMLTDPDLDMLALARQFQDLSAGNISYATIPNDGPQTIYPDGVETSIVAVDAAAMPGFINQLQGKPADPGLATAPAAKPSSVTLDVLNGTVIAGLAGRNAAALRKVGFHVETIDSTARPTPRRWNTRRARRTRPRPWRARCPGAQLTQTESVKKVTLVLGADGRQAAGLASTAPSSAASRAPSTAAKPPTATGLGCIN